MHRLRVEGCLHIKISKNFQMFNTTCMRIFYEYIIFSLNYDVILWLCSFTRVRVITIVTAIKSYLRGTTFAETHKLILILKESLSLIHCLVFKMIAMKNDKLSLSSELCHYQTFFYIKRNRETKQMCYGIIEPRSDP